MSPRRSRAERIQGWLSRKWLRSGNDALYLNIRHDNLGYNVSVWRDTEGARNWGWRIHYKDRCPTRFSATRSYVSASAAKEAVLNVLAEELNI